MTDIPLPAEGDTSWTDWAAEQETASDVVAGGISVAEIAATGTPSASTFLRGDGTWTAPTGGAATTDASLLTSGTLPVARLADGSIPPVKLAATGTRSSTTFLRGDGTWSTTPAAQGAADATTTSKGLVQLAGDLAGTATAPTVPGLAGKANTSHTHAVADISATGTRSATTYLRGDGTWATPPAGDGGGGGTTLGTFNVRDYGATGNGTTVDTTAIQAAYNAANTAGGGIVYYPPGTYLAGNLVTYSNTTSMGAGAGVSIIKQVTGSTYGLSINPGSAGTANVADNIHDVVVMDLGFRGTIDVDGFAEHTFLLNMNAATQVQVTRCDFIGFRGDGIYVGSGNTAGIERHNRQIKIDHCFFDGVTKQNRNGISVIDGDDVEISNNTFVRMTQAAMPGGVDIEPNPGSTWGICRDIRVLNNTFTDIGGFCCVSISVVPDNNTVTVPFQNIRIEGNHFNAPQARGVILRSNTTTTSTAPQNNITVRNNMSIAGTEPYLINGVRGVYVSDNMWVGNTQNGEIGTIYPVRDLYITNDTYHQLADPTTGAVHRIYAADNIKFDGNRYINCGKADGTAGIILHLLSPGTTSDIDFTRNTVTGTRTTSVVTLQGGAITTPMTNLAHDNITGALAIPATSFSMPPSSAVRPARTVSASGTFTLQDARTGIVANSASAIVLTVPPNSEVPFPIGTILRMEQHGAGALTVVAGTGVTVLSPSTTRGARARYSTIELWKYNADGWILSGDLPA